MALLDNIISAESGGDPNAQNSSSSAGGLGQFIDSTWLNTVRAHRPDLAGMTDSQILALKKDPGLSREMTGAYASDNQDILRSKGLPVTPGTTYLAHFAGPGGAAKVLQADPSTPISQVLGNGAVAANPFMRNYTAGDLLAWADRKMGTITAPTLPPAQEVTPAPQVAQVPPPATPPIFPQTAQQTPQQVPAQAPGGGYSPANLFSQLTPPPPPQVQPFYAPPPPKIDFTQLAQALSSRGSMF